MFDFLVGNDLLLSIIAFGIVLIPAVIIHEMGHFLAAKAVGITVLEFGIGFPPRATRLFMWGETEFTLNWIPLGGFVRPLGEDLIRPLDDAAVERDRQKLGDMVGDPLFLQQEMGSAERAQPDNTQETSHVYRLESTMTVNETPPLRRIFFMAAGAIANFISAFILFAAVGLIGLPTNVGGRVELFHVPAESRLAQAGVQAGDLVERINGKTIQSTQDFFNTLDALSGNTITLSILRGPTGEMFDTTVTLARETRESLVRILSIERDSPAHLSGLLADDLIIAVNDRSLTSEIDPIQIIQDHTVEYAGQTLTIRVLREVDNNTETLDIPLIPRIDPQEGQGRVGIGIWVEFRTDSGVTYLNGPPQQDLVPLSVTGAITYGFDRTLMVLGLIAEFPVRIIRGTIPAEQARPMSIVGISQAGGQFLARSIEDQSPILILNFVAMISIALGATNLLPFPAFDGGRIVFVLLEIVRGRPVSPEREGLVHLIGFVFLLSVGLIIILHDLLNPLPNLLG